MGLWTDFLTTLGLYKRKVNILCIGLDNSGKSTIINHFKFEKIPATEIIPTVGFTVDHFTTAKSRLQFTVFDMSGQGRYRDLWAAYYPDADAIIFVVDVADRVRVCVARDELEGCLGHRVLKAKKIPILFYANKMDLEGGMTPTECANAMGLENIKDRNWNIVACNALTGEGLDEGVDWLAGQIK
ncbi:ADP-ribosylation factor-like protein 6 [Rhizophlyctis rosea]|nr:ADP-ribosylation factor-like protein 6 [Rhizophlyctis rosea]